MYQNRSSTEEEMDTGEVNGMLISSGGCSDISDRVCGLKIHRPETVMHIQDEEKRIKILHVGKRINLPIKTVILVGETGSGKTTLLNKLCNHFHNVKFEDNFRWKLFDEVGDDMKETYESQTEWVTGYLFYYQPGMRYKYNILIIDTPGMADTRGAQKEMEIIKQMETFLSDEKYGIVDLHCLGFVVNSTVNRAQGHFQTMVTQCMSLFGEDTNYITQILATHAADKTKTAKKILDFYHVNAEKIFFFDNGTLYLPNKPGISYSEDYVSDEEDINIWRARWKKQTQACHEFFQILFMMPAVSLRLTRERQREKAFLEHTKANLCQQLESACKHIVAIKEKEKLLKENEKVKEINRQYKQTIAVKEMSAEKTPIMKTKKGRRPIVKQEKHRMPVVEKKRIPISESLDKRWYMFFPHVHNCGNCIKTCTGICHLFWIDCPSSCNVCSCDINDHYKDDGIYEEELVYKDCMRDIVTYEDFDEEVWENQLDIKEEMVDKEITNDAMKREFQEAEVKTDEIRRELENLQRLKDGLRSDIAKMVKRISLHMERLDSISKITNHQSLDEFLEAIVEDLQRNNSEFRKYFDESFDEFLQSAYKEAETVEIDMDQWIRDIEQKLKSSDSTWKKMTAKVFKAIGKK